jgi:ATP-binding cassette subfamily F protein 3
VLALLVYQNPNLLLLDEPTNHLDLEMRQALSVALQDYEGAIVLVSHDRHLLRTVADQFVLVADKQCRPFDGDLDDYRLWLAEQKRNINNQKDDAISGLSRKDQRKLEAERRQQQKPLLDALKKAEQAVENYHGEQRRLEIQLSDPEIYADGQKTNLKNLLAQKAEIDKALADAEATWLSVEEQLSAANITA